MAGNRARNAGSPVTRRPVAEAAPAGVRGWDGFSEICTVRIELLHTDPVIWRLVEVPTSTTPKVLHDIIQITIGWFDCHLWEFVISGRLYGLPVEKDWGMAPRADAIKICLRDVLDPSTTTIDYLYDMGDSWEHRLTATAIRPGEPDASYPRYIGGEWAGPPEDCGGIPGFYDLLDVMADPAHPHHGEIMEAYDGYDPKEIDELPLKIALGRIANRRNAGQIRLAKQKP